MPRPEEMGEEAWDKLTATVSDDQLEWIENFAECDQARLIPNYAILGLIARLRAAEVDAGRLNFVERNPGWLRRAKRGWCCVNPFTNYAYTVYSTAREAIDQAMKEQSK